MQPMPYFRHGQWEGGLQLGQWGLKALRSWHLLCCFLPTSDDILFCDEDDSDILVWQGMTIYSLK